MEWINTSDVFYGGGGKKKLDVFFSATMEQNITRVNFLRKARESSILMAIDALDAIPLELGFGRAIFKEGLATP